MASPEDVIELGSSDEETQQPTPKRRKVVPNAMVRIPSKTIPRVTIKPAINKVKISPIPIAKATIGKGVTVTKVSKVSSSNLISNPFANKNKVNGKLIGKPKQFNPLSIIKTSTVPIINNPALNVTRKINTNLPIITNTEPIPFAKVLNTISLAKTSSLLPPGITVKKTSQLSQSGMKPNIKQNPVNIQGRMRVHPILASKTKVNEVFCVDDDDTPPTSSGPQWYLRPEEQESKTSASTKKSIAKLEKSSDLENETNNSKEREEVTTELDKDTNELEQQNNKEPETDFIEITIEDSPAKIHNKRTSHVAELAITIEDSPVKGTAERVTDIGSDDENNISKEKQSKKKLDYPKTDTAAESMEIEIEFTPLEKTGNQNDNNEADSQDDVVETEIFLIDESPVKPADQMDESTPKKNFPPRPKLKLNKAKPALIQPAQSLKPKETGEFHPIYQKFIDLCFQLENSEDMHKIVERKIKGYYRQVPREYTESEIFTDMVSSKISAMKVGPEKMYLYIKDVVDELNLQRKIAKSQPVKLDTISEEQEKIMFGEDSEFDSKHQRQIRKLEKTLKKLHRAIQKLEEQEVDFDDEEDSVYLLTESQEGASKDMAQPLQKAELLKRYKERMMRVHAKFCQLTNTKMPSEPRVQIDARPGQPKGPAKRLEKWVNKKVPIGTPLPFPDFHDVLRCVRDANEEDNLGWNEADIMEEARDLFTRCGKKLQRRRQENEWRLAASRIQQDNPDPAEGNEDLKKKLEENRQVASKKESEVLNKFADRQKQLNLEVVEIGDQEANESPVESDDEEPAEQSTSLETKEKRKDRLKRLLQEKSKKVSDSQKTKSNVENNIQSDIVVPKAENDNTEAIGLKENVEKEVNKTGDEQFEKTLEEEIKDIENEELKETGKQTDTGVKDTKANNIETSPMEIENTETDRPSIEDEIEDCKQSDSEKILSLSDDSYKISSDIDELHLLQKLHSDEYNSSTFGSDSESPIAISDTLSSSDNKNHASDVISIENSSYSESENKNNEQERESLLQNKIITETVNVEMEIECSNAGVEKKINKSNNYEYNGSVENILLASSDEEINDVEKDAQDRDTKEINANELNNEGPNKNADTTDASSMESVEITSVKHVDPNELNADNAIEITSVTSTDTDVEMISKQDEAISENAAEVTSIISTETVEETNDNQNDDDTVETICTSSLKSIEDVTMTNLVGEIADNFIAETSKDTAKATEGTAEATEGTAEATEDTAEANTAKSSILIEATDQSVEVTEHEDPQIPNKDSKKTACNDKQSDEIPNNIKNTTDIRVEECSEKELRNLPAPELMEVNDAIDKI